MNFIINAVNLLFCNYYFLKVIRFITIQNIIAIAILPLYGSWGISFSILNLFGNFFFLPFLVLYLFLSAIILFAFFFDYIFFSFIYFQKYILDMWIFLMQYFEKISPIKAFCFVNYPLFSYPICFLVLFFLFFLKKKKIETLFFFLYSSLFLSILLILFYNLPSRVAFKVIVDGEKVYCIRKLSDKKVLLHLYGGNYRQKTFDKKIKYMIISEIRKNFGIYSPLIII